MAHVKEKASLLRKRIQNKKEAAKISKPLFRKF